MVSKYSSRLTSRGKFTRDRKHDFENFSKGASFRPVAGMHLQPKDEMMMRNHPLITSGS